MGCSSISPFKEAFYSGMSNIYFCIAPLLLIRCEFYKTKANEKDWFSKHEKLGSPEKRGLRKGNKFKGKGLQKEKSEKAKKIKNEKKGGNENRKKR